MASTASLPVEILEAILGLLPCTCSVAWASLACRRWYACAARWSERSEGSHRAATSCAASSGSLSLLRWMRSHGFPWSAAAPGVAALRGHLAVLEWMGSNKCEFDCTALVGALLDNNLETLRWLCAQGVRGNEYVAQFAAHCANVDALKLLRARGCPWDASTCNEACRVGQLPMLQWARANGCPWDAHACATIAMQRDDRHVLRWMQSQGALRSCFEAFLQLGSGPRQIEMFRWLHSIGCPLGDMVCHMSPRRNAGLHAFLASLEGRCPCGGAEPHAEYATVPVDPWFLPPFPSTMGF